MAGRGTLGSLALAAAPSALETGCVCPPPNNRPPHPTPPHPPTPAAAA